MKLLLIYFFVLGFICIRDLFKVKNFDDYVVAGRKQSSPFVFMSLMATVLGASATVGIAARAESIGFAAFWWLAVGAIGFWFQAAFLSKPVHDLDVRTLPEIAEKTVGKTGRKLVALIIAVSWIGIIAAQFAAVAGFIGSGGFIGRAKREGRRDAACNDFELANIEYFHFGYLLHI